MATEIGLTMPADEAQALLAGIVEVQDRIDGDLPEAVTDFKHQLAGALGMANVGQPWRERWAPIDTPENP